MGAFEDLAAKLGQDPYDLFLQNIALTGVRAEDLRGGAREGRGADGLEEELAPARRQRPGTRSSAASASRSTPGAGAATTATAT